MFKLIQKETNRYAKQQINKSKRAVCHPNLYLHCGTVSLQEIKKFFVIIIHMSVLRRSSLQDYWTLSPIIHTPYAASV